MTEPDSVTISLAPSVAAAEARSVAARARLSETFSALQARLSPKALASEAATNIVQAGKSLATDGVETARNNPATAIGGAAAVAVLLARRPIGRLFHRLWNRDEDATATDLTSLKSRRRATADERTEP